MFGFVASLTADIFYQLLSVGVLGTREPCVSLELFHEALQCVSFRR
jgi:hypothetical protein